MSLKSTLGLGRVGSLSALEGTPEEVAAKRRQANAEQMRPARLEVARRNSKWTEIENDLVPRNRGRWLVSASTDAVYAPMNGVVFQPHSSTVVADQAELHYYVDDAGDLHFLEKQPYTWSEHVGSRERRRTQRARA